jgi:hypothetical protein
MDKILSIILLLISVQGNCQRMELVKVCDMKANGTTDEWRYVVIDTVKKIDTTNILAESLIMDSSGKILGWNTDKGVVLIKEKPKPTVNYPSVYFSDTTSMLAYSIDVVYKKSTRKKRKKNIPKHHYKVVKAHTTGTSYQTVKYFKGYGEVYDQSSEFVILLNPKGTFYNHRIKSGP